MALHGQLRAEQCLTFTAHINQTEPNAVDVEKWFLFNFYRQQTELREGIVSQVSVCQSFCPQAVGTSHASWDRSYGKVFPSSSIRHHTSPPPPRQHTWEHTSPLPSQTSDLDTYLLLLTSGGHHWRPVQLFKLVHLRANPHQYWQLVVAIETCTVGKWTVRIVFIWCLRKIAD